MGSHICWPRSWFDFVPDEIWGVKSKLIITAGSPGREYAGDGESSKQVRQQKAEEFEYD